jgi:ankyrin repeat protein
LHIAARLGHEDCLLALLENGFDPNYLEKDGTALHVAIKQGQAEIARILMEKGEINWKEWKF